MDFRDLIKVDRISDIIKDEIDLNLNRDVMNSCFSYGVIHNTTFENGKAGYEIRLIYSASKAQQKYLATFDELCFDAFLSKKQIFTKQLINGNPWIAGYVNNYPVTILKYRNAADMLEDLYSASTFINEKLDADKSKDN